MKVILDTNALLVALPHPSKFRLIYDFFLQGKYDLLLTTEIIFEYLEVIGNKTNEHVANGILDSLLTAENVLPTKIYYKWNLIRADPDDNKFTDCAIAGNADFIVSNDAHFRMLKFVSFPKVNFSSSSFSKE